jgi:hypothetical protein
MAAMPIRETWLAVALAAVVLAATACSGTDTATTTTTTSATAPPSTTTSAAPTTTSTAAPAPLDPVAVETLGISITVPRDWVVRQDGITYGRVAALIDTEEGPGGVLFIGLASEDLDFADQGTPAEVADASADLFAEFFFPSPGTSEVTVTETTTLDGVSAQIVERAVAHEDGTTSVSRFVLIEAEGETMYAAFLYQGDLNEQRIAEGEAVLESIVFD